VSADRGGSAVVVYDDAAARRFQPFALTRPASELVAGTTLIADRWSVALGPVNGFVSSAHLADFAEAGRPPMAAVALPAGTILANSRCIAALEPADGDADVWTCDGRVAAVRLHSATDAGALADGRLELEELARSGRSVAIAGRWITEIWDLLGGLNAQLADDIPLIARARGVHAREGAAALGDHPVFIDADVSMAPYVCLDTTAGPIFIGRHCSVAPFTRIAGPCYFDEHVTIAGDSIASSSVGAWSKVHGELSSSIVIGHSNKGHFGFVGHSYLGRWVNLGAGTTTSNLKNTYGTVSLWTPDGVRDTGLQFLGTLFGDHVKTGIGMRLNTGTVLGAGASVFDAMPPKMVEPFSWGSGAPYDRFQLDKFLDVAERMMERRRVPLTERARRQLSAAHAAHGRAGR